ncbi:calcium-binding protein [Sinorhizobium sp. BJ1]|uniref:calcium-binding protein n=1 Tax=Sinorhizobium sp. BJ1 TaxID=2035455 RepID=UPI000BEA5347|nr:calcium-binding protein [Sinorhizobium sp. BJ1]PDT82453.1 protease [Sinorhizobium sp. BJ1]
MGKLTVASNYGFDQWSFDFSNMYYGTSYVRTSTTFRINYSDGTSEVFQGTGFKYDAFGAPYSGTATSYAGYYKGQALVVFTGGSIAVSDIVAAANTASDLSDDEEVIFNALRGNDTLTGGNLRDVMAGFNGNDVVNGNAGNDTLFGNEGNDTIIGGSGKDAIDGGNGSDTASYATSVKGVTAHLANTAMNTNDAFGDAYFGIEDLIGSAYGDRLYGDSAANWITGGNGNDAISAGGGNDRINGGAGADRLWGGSGADRFIFKALADSAGSLVDTIFGFVQSTGDRIDLSAIDASTNVSADQAFTFIGTTGFHGKAGELRYVKQASDTYIYADVNGDKKADLAIHLDDALTLTKDYFIL